MSEFAMDLTRRAFDTWLLYRQTIGSPPNVFLISPEMRERLLDDGISKVECFGVPVEVSSEISGDSIRAVGWGRIPKGILP